MFRGNRYEIDELSQEEQISQMLNMSPNYSKDKNYIIDMLKRYHRIFAHLMDRNLKKSMKHSEKNLFSLCDLTYKIKTLKNNVVNSFLLKIYFTDDHSIPMIFRKIDNKLSITLVNKTYQNMGGQYIEFIFNNGNKIDANLLVNDNKLTTEDFYLKLFRACDNFCVLGVISRGQKEFNCFVKEPEAAIKFILSTKDFTMEKLIELRNNEHKFHLSWPYDTLKTRQIYLDSIIVDKRKHIKMDKFASATLDRIEEKFNVYAMNKRFRKLLKEGLQVTEAILSAYGAVEDSKNAFTKYLSLETLIYKYDDIYNYMFQLKKTEQLEKAAKIKEIYYRNAFIELDSKDIEGYRNDFTFISEQLREQAAVKLLKESLLSVNINDRLNLIDKTLSIYPNFSEAYFLKGDLLLNDGKNNEAIKYYKEAQKLKPLNKQYKEAEQLARERGLNV
jgi:hypothetical protein